MIRTYSKLALLGTFEERFDYLKLGSRVGEMTFGYERYLNQIFYQDALWKTARQKAIIRDSACDLGLDGFNIYGTIFVHHINPISKQDIINRDPKLFDLENLICCSSETHNAIHYGDMLSVISAPIERYSGDTCPWKRG